MEELKNIEEITNKFIEEAEEFIEKYKERDYGRNKSRRIL